MTISIMSQSKDAGVRYNHHIMSLSKDANTAATDGSVLISKSHSFLHDSKMLLNIKTFYNIDNMQNRPIQNVFDFCQTHPSVQ